MNFSLCLGLIAGLIPWGLVAIFTNWFTEDHGTLSQTHGLDLIIWQVILGWFVYLIAERVKKVKNNA